MPTLILDVLKYVFLGLLYIFVARAVRAIYIELRPAEKAEPKRRTGTGTPPPSRKPRKPPASVHVIEGGLKGKVYSLGDECLIGRADKCQIVLDDNYASQMHARIHRQNGGFLAEDLGSTNGTYLNGRRLTSPAEVQRGDRLKIGKTVMELRK